MIVETAIEDLVLRTYEYEDAAPLAMHADNYNIWKFMRDDFPLPFMESTALLYIEKNMKNKGDISLAVSFQGELIGDIHVTKQNDIQRHSGFMGYWLAEEYWGRGFMTEAVAAMTRYVFTYTGMIRIYARVFSTNAGSIRVLEKAGFEQEGRFKNAVFKEGKLCDQLQYAKLKEMG